MAAVSNVNLIIHKGTYFEEDFTLSGDDGDILNLTNHSAACKLRKHPKSTTSFSFATSITVSTGTVKVSMASTITSTLPSGRCYYDLVLTNPLNKLSKVLQGNVIVEETSSI